MSSSRRRLVPNRRPGAPHRRRPSFAPTGKAHPGFAVARYDELLDRLRDAGVGIAEDDAIPGVRRCYVSDPWGNRIELVAG